MIYRFAAACAMALELLMAMSLVDLPKAHSAGPLAVAGGFFIGAFALTEAWECLGIGRFLKRIWRRVRDRMRRGKAP